MLTSPQTYDTGTTLQHGQVTVICFRKIDLESADDEKLAIKELKTVSGCTPSPIDETAAGALLGGALEHLPFNADSTFTLTCSPEIVSHMARTVAFWRHFAFRADDKIIVKTTQSETLESTVMPRLKEGPGKSGEYLLSPSNRKKNNYLTHNIHKYKAKFFPRLARSLIGITSSDYDLPVLDPFCGSGTTNVEARLMGMPSVGFDIDPLSILISRAKAGFEGLLDKETKAFLSECIVASSRGYTAGIFDRSSPEALEYRIPRFLVARSPRRLPNEEATKIEADVSRLLLLTESAPNQYAKDVARVALSHAISTKISLRWMGTGDDRFALEVAKRDLSSIFSSHLKLILSRSSDVAALIECGAVPRMPAPRIQQSDARQLPLDDNSIGSVVTSPPYLPAASGRETYLRSRAASLTALGLMTEEEVLHAEKSMVGSILAGASLETSKVPSSVRDLAEWMLPQRERTAKALPTIAYFESLRSILKEINRVLVPGGKAAFVVSKEHVFWELATKRVLWRFDMASALAEMIEDDRFGVSMDIVEVIDLELPKMDFVARPGAKHRYFESIVIFQKRR